MSDGAGITLCVLVGALWGSVSILLPILWRIERDLSTIKDNTREIAKKPEGRSF